jgi:hypothetical protein
MIPALKLPVLHVLQCFSQNDPAETFIFSCHSLLLHLLTFWSEEDCIARGKQLESSKTLASCSPVLDRKWPRRNDTILQDLYTNWLLLLSSTLFVTVD